MALDPADQKRGGALLEIRNAQPFRKKVIAVQLDKGIEIRQIVLERKTGGKSGEYRRKK